ncbi:hypothetical protein BpHYR1_027303, partial [Brachionus plicatilis]
KIAIIIKRVAYILNYVRDKILKKNKDAIANYQIRLLLSFLYPEKTTKHNFTTDIFIFHLISHCSSSLVPLFVINEECKRLMIVNSNYHVFCINLKARYFYVLRNKRMKKTCASKLYNDQYFISSSPFID